MTVNVAEAKNNLPELIKAVEGGEAVTICRRGIPVVDIVPTKSNSQEKRQFGTLKGKVEVLDSDWWKPMSDTEVDECLGGTVSEQKS